MEINFPCYNERPEIWAGIECTINRIGDKFRDQLIYSGHYYREQDICQFADLGITALRYPVLWEFHQQIKNQPIDWTWAEQRLCAIKDKNIIPIAGLLHHGSGPSYTDLLDENFACYFKDFASRVAENFPWLGYYTPINEPLTTARFSGLYGFWYPHEQNDSAFVLALLHQLKATILAMQAIRKINPHAKLVQTEDMGKTQSTPILRYQSEFENERRWLTFDLLCGTVTKYHPLWDYLINAGASHDQLNFFLENQCKPDILGVNYYVTSERFLDDNCDEYPRHLHGGNVYHKYVDIETVRSKHCSAFGLSHILHETWRRYQIPIAITEVHLNCTREEQMRWFHDCWTICCKARREGLDIKAITAWSLLGSFDWNSLLTENDQHYESGVFKLVDGRPQETALSHMIRQIAKTGTTDHPLLQQKGWWHKTREQHSTTLQFDERLLIVCSNDGRRSKCLTAICSQRNIPMRIVNNNLMPFLNFHRELDKCRCWALVYIPNFAEMQEPAGEFESFALNNHLLDLIDYCRGKMIQLCIVASSHYAECLSEHLTIHNIGLTQRKISIVVSDEFASSQTAGSFYHAALDVIIDKQFGLTYLPEGIHKITIGSFGD